MASNAVAAAVGLQTEVVDIRPHQLLSVIRRRDARTRYFSTELFSDPAWDILLDLAHARLSAGSPVLRVARTLSPTAVARWLDLLADEGLITLRGDHAVLSDSGLAAINAWLTGGC